MENETKLMQCFFITQPESSIHYHQDPEIIYMLKGKMEVQIDEAVYQLQEGDFILINANKRHSCVGMPDILGVRLLMDFHMMVEHMGTLQPMFWCNTAADRNDAYEDIRKLLDQILSVCSGHEEKGVLYLNALYYGLLYRLASYFMVKADDIRVNRENSQDHIRIQQIQNYIQANYQTQISLNDLAQRLYLSNVYLSKYIKKHLGLTFLEYLNNVRLYHAVDELLYTNKSITRIAMDNGFPTSAAFIKVFRNMHCEAPSQYRKRMQKSLPAPHCDAQAEEKGPGLVQEYLKSRQAAQQENGGREQVCTADAGRYEIPNVLWKQGVNVGEAYTLLQSEAQNQLIQIQRETGMVYARIWNLFSREQCMEENGTLNFRRLDLVLDFIVDHHMKPYIELSGSADAQGQVGHEEFCDMIRAFCLHLINRYGLEEVEGWYFEYWKGSGPGLPKEEYFSRFEVIYRTFKEITPEIRVGGAGFLLGYENAFCREFLRNWKKRAIRPDFLSFCSYQYISVVDGEQVYGGKSIDSGYMKNQMDLVREMIGEEGFQVSELHIDGWNFTDSDRNVFNDSCTQGAYIVKTCISMLGSADLMAYWHGLDLGSEHGLQGLFPKGRPAAGQERAQQVRYDSQTVLNGDSGMISRDGIRKPSFYAFQFMNRLQSHVVCRDENSIVTSNGRGRFTIVCHNYKKFSSRYAFCREEEIGIDEMGRYLEEAEPLKQKFRLENIKNGTYQVKVHYMNRENGSAQDIWRMMEYQKVLSKDEIEYVKRRAMPSIEIRTVQVGGGALELGTVLQPQEIRLLDIQYRYAI